MFQDDRTIPFLTAIIIMVALGTVLQRSDIMSSWNDDGDQIVLADDVFALEAGQFHTVDILENDVGIDRLMWDDLAIAEKPECGRAWIKGGTLRYSAPRTCIGEQFLAYELKGEGLVATVTMKVYDPSGPAPEIEQSTQQPELLAAAPTDGQQVANGDGSTVTNETAGGGTGTAINLAVVEPTDDDEIPIGEIPRGGAASADDIARALERSAEEDLAEPTDDDGIEAIAEIISRGSAGGAEAATANEVPSSAAETAEQLDPARVTAEVEPAAPADETTVIAAVQPAAPVEEQSIAAAPAADEQPAAPAAETPLVQPATPAVEPAEVAEPVREQLSTPQEQAPATTEVVEDAAEDAAEDVAEDRLAAVEPKVVIAVPNLDDAAQQDDGIAPATAATTPADSTRVVRVDPASPTGDEEAITDTPEKPEIALIDDSAVVVVARLTPRGTPSVVSDEADRDGLKMAYAAGALADPDAVRVIGPQATDQTGVQSLDGARLLEGPVQPGRYEIRNWRAPAAAGDNSAEQPAGQDTVISALTPATVTARDDVGPALSRDLVDREQLPPAPAVLEARLPAPRPADDAAAPAVTEESSQPEPAAQPEQQLAALPAPAAPCVIPPSMRLDVRRAARTIVGVSAPCQANTVAELAYAGLRFAVPLNKDGEGSILTLGFESNAPALLSFEDGQKIDFDLPFKNINQISRVALVWDLPIALELNALEFGAEVDDPNHVHPGNARDFEAVRRSGGGFLNGFRAHRGVGQNIQIYSHWHRSGGESGIVRMLIDFASRNRDRLDGTCGDGRYAAPQFLVLQSVRGRPERAILRRLAALACSSVPEEKGDKRLISGAIGDLVVNR